MVRFVHFYMKNTDISELNQEFLLPLYEKEMAVSVHISATPAPRRYTTEFHGKREQRPLLMNGIFLEMPPHTVIRDS